MLYNRKEIFEQLTPQRKNLILGKLFQLDIKDIDIMMRFDLIRVDAGWHIESTSLGEEIKKELEISMFN